MGASTRLLMSMISRAFGCMWSWQCLLWRLSSDDSRGHTIVLHRCTLRQPGQHRLMVFEKLRWQGTPGGLYGARETYRPVSARMPLTEESGSRASAQGVVVWSRLPVALGNMLTSVYFVSLRRGSGGRQSAASH